MLITRNSAIVIFFIILVSIFLITKWLLIEDYSIKSYNLEKIVQNLITEFGITKNDLAYESFQKYRVGRAYISYIRKKYKIKYLDFNPAQFREKLEFILLKNGYKLKRYEFIYEDKKIISNFNIGYKKFNIYSLGFESPKITEAKVGIVIDDWGYRLDNLSSLFKIKRPLTISILPNLDFSTQIAKAVSKKNFEIILHLPLEPKEKKRLEMETITTDMNKEQISFIIKKAIKSVPYLKGVSNHMGSKATENEKLMRKILGIIKKLNLYFLDSLVTNNSVCGKVAEELGVKFTKRSIFLDNHNEPGYIRAQLERLSSIALKYGSAIGIGHERRQTIDIIFQMIPELEKRGIEFVYVSELVK